jgi:peptide/nickel transport system substrate-binding protein
LKEKGMATQRRVNMTQRAMSRRGLLGAAARAGAAGLVATSLAACGSKGRLAPVGQSATSTQPRAGGTFNTSISYNALLDPQKVSAGAQVAVGGVYSRLFRFVAGPDVKTFTDHDVENDLAASIESPDAVIWTVKLRPDARFHNIPPVNGHAVEADDVKATFVRALDPATSNPNRGSIGMIDPSQIEMPNKQTVVFKLAYPYAPFHKTLASPAYAMIFPREVLTGAYDPAKTVIGSGPFLLDSVQPDVATTYKRNADWFEKGRPYVDAYRVAVISDTAQQQAQFAAGNLDEISPGTPDDLAAIRQQVPKALTLKAPNAAPYPMWLQLGDPTSPFLDVRLRRALSMAIDRDALGKVVYAGEYEQMLALPSYMGKWALHVQDLAPDVQQYYKPNPTAVKQLLDAAGATSLQLRFVNIVNGAFSTPNYEKQVQALANMLNAAGIKTTIITQDYNKDYIDSGHGSRQGYYDKDMVLFAAISSYTDADEFLFSYFHSKSTSNEERLKDPQLDAMIDKERTLVDENARLQAVHDIERYLAAQMYNVPTVGGYAYAAVQPRVQNYEYTNGLGKATENYAKLWLQH